MANDPTYPAALRTATTHVGTGGNPKVGVPVDYLRLPPGFFLLLPLSLPAFLCLTIFSPHLIVLPTTASLPNDDTCTGASPSPQWCKQSEEQEANLVHDSAALLFSLAPP
jgi:hypothetical protein